MTAASLEREKGVRRPNRDTSALSLYVIRDVRSATIDFECGILALFASCMLRVSGIKVDDYTYLRDDFRFMTIHPVAVTRASCRAAADVKHVTFATIYDPGSRIRNG